jgi:hypothetical protein
MVKMFAQLLWLVLGALPWHRCSVRRRRLRQRAQTADEIGDRRASAASASYNAKREGHRSNRGLPKAY